MMYEKPSYQTPPPEKPKASVYIGVIIGLSILAMILAMLLLAGLRNKDEDNSTLNSQQTPVATPVIAYNSDSAALAQLRDSLNSSAGIAQSGTLASVFLEKMNVLYIGVDNPVTIQVGGVTPANQVISISGGSLVANGKPGSYIARVTGGTKATINISVKENGVTKTVGNYDYRIKRVPDPVAYVGAIKGTGKMTKAEVGTISGVFARMENFDFDLKFNVVSFVMSVNVNGVYVDKISNGPGVTPEMKTLLGSVKPGNRVLFKDIKVQGPDGTLRLIAPVIIEVK
jgi:hypothetical protein